MTLSPPPPPSGPAAGPGPYPGAVSGAPVGPPGFGPPVGPPGFGPPVASTPSPPPGPGVQPPFVSPPTDGARQRRWLALGLAGAAALVCCVGGLFGAGGLLVLGNKMILDEAQGTVTSYLSAVRDKDYAGAYALVCDTERASIDESEFVDMFERGPTLRSFSVGPAVLTEELVVPATLDFADGRSLSLEFLMSQDSSTGAFEVCGQRG